MNEERKNGVGYFFESRGEAGVFQRLDGSMFYRDTTGQETEIGYADRGSVPNPVDEVAVGIVASTNKPIPLLVTGPPVGFEDDYLVAVVTGEPDYKRVFFVDGFGGVTVSPTSSAVPALTIESLASTDSEILHVTSEAGDVLTVFSDGSFRLTQPGVGVVFDVDSSGGVKVGREDGTVSFYGGEPVAKPEVPASPDAQDIVDALVALGLISQAE